MAVLQGSQHLRAEGIAAGAYIGQANNFYPLDKLLRRQFFAAIAEQPVEGDYAHLLAGGQLLAGDIAHHLLHATDRGQVLAHQMDNTQAHSTTSCARSCTCSLSV